MKNSLREEINIVFQCIQNIFVFKMFLYPKCYHPSIDLYLDRLKNLEQFNVAIENVSRYARSIYRSSATETYKMRSAPPGMGPYPRPP